MEQYEMSFYSDQVTAAFFYIRRDILNEINSLPSNSEKSQDLNHLLGFLEKCEEILLRYQYHELTYAVSIIYKTFLRTHIPWPMPIKGTNVQPRTFRAKLGPVLQALETNLTRIVKALIDVYRQDVMKNPESWEMRDTILALSFEEWKETIISKLKILYNVSLR